MLASDCLAGGGGANDYGAWLTASVRMRRVANSICALFQIFSRLKKQISELSLFSLLRFLCKRDDNCQIQVPIGCRKKLSEDEKVRFSVAPDGWSSSSSGEDDFVEPIKRKRSLQPKKTSGKMQPRKKRYLDLVEKTNCVFNTPVERTGILLR